jgi:hypothetical protein
MTMMQFKGTEIPGTLQYLWMVYIPNSVINYTKHVCNSSSILLSSYNSNLILTEGCHGHTLKSLIHVFKIRHDARCPLVCLWNTWRILIRGIAQILEVVECYTYPCVFLFGQEFVANWRLKQNWYKNYIINKNLTVILNFGSMFYL